MTAATTTPVMQFAMLRTFLSRLPIGVAIYDRFGELVYLNEFGSRIMNEKSCRKLEDLLGHRDHNSTNSDLQHHDIEIERFRNNKWLRMTSFEYLDEYYNEEYIVVIIKDITDIKRNHGLIQLSEEWFKTMDDNVKEGIYKCDHQLNFLYANKAFLDMFGLKCDEDLKQMTFDSLFQDPKCFKALKKFTENEGIIQNQVVVFRADNKEFHGLLTQSMNASERGSYYWGAITDISQSIRKDEVIRNQSEKIDATKEQIDRILYSASHDLRSPLSSLEGLVHLMSREFVMTPGITEYLAQVDTTIKSMDKVLSGLDSFLKNSKERVISNRVDVYDIYVRCKSHVVSKYRGYDIKFIEEFDLHNYLYTDSNKLEVLLTNLLSNAVQFIDRNQVSKEISIYCRATARELMLEISDNGEGIAKGHLAGVFDLFYKASPNSGPGIGLYVVKEIVSKLNGTIQLKSYVNKGTTVQLAIPNGVKGQLISKKLSLKIAQSR